MRRSGREKKPALKGKRVAFADLAPDPPSEPSTKPAPKAASKTTKKAAVKASKAKTKAPKALKATVIPDTQVISSDQEASPPPQSSPPLRSSPPPPLPFLVTLRVVIYVDNSDIHSFSHSIDLHDVFRLQVDQLKQSAQDEVVRYTAEERLVRTVEEPLRWQGYFGPERNPIRQDIRLSHLQDDYKAFELAMLGRKQSHSASLQIRYGLNYPAGKEPPIELNSSQPKGKSKKEVVIKRPWLDIDTEDDDPLATPTPLAAANTVKKARSTATTVLLSDDRIDRYTESPVEAIKREIRLVWGCGKDTCNWKNKLGHCYLFDSTGASTPGVHYKLNDDILTRWALDIQQQEATHKIPTQEVKKELRRKWDSEQALQKALAGSSKKGKEKEETLAKSSKSGDMLETLSQMMGIRMMQDMQREEREQRAQRLPASYPASYSVPFPPTVFSSSPPYHNESDIRSGLPLNWGNRQPPQHPTQRPTQHFAQRLEQDTELDLPGLRQYRDTFPSMQSLRESSPLRGDVPIPDQLNAFYRYVNPLILYLPLFVLTVTAGYRTI